VQNKDMETKGGFPEETYYITRQPITALHNMVQLVSMFYHQEIHYKGDMQAH
jgi:hypothetical protein